MTRTVLLASLLIVLAAPALADANEEANMARNLQFYQEVVNAGDLDRINDFIAEDYVEHESFPGLPQSREGVKQFFDMMRTAFPDVHFDVEFMLADGEKVVSYITMTGTHKGEFMGMAPSGKAFSIESIDIVRIVDGKAVEHWGVTDVMGMMQQLGAVPSMAPAGE
jgi:steroid delta-isomerase-like uncharacterized protein